MVLEIIKTSLWNGQTVDLVVTEEDSHEMQVQAIVGLPAGILLRLSMSGDLKQVWHMEILRQLSCYTRYTYEQARLPLTVPYVILKGSAAAQYYPHPEYRTMGDIDIMPRREDFELAYQELLDGGFEPVGDLKREVKLRKNSLLIELHRYFASLNDPEKAKYLDDLILGNINPSHVLPDPVNGLVLLEHISQHLENGLGLRQIIDWMMFVDQCLPDDKWAEFEPFARNIGLERLAVMTTRMCEMYLGLSRHAWCAEADEAICARLKDYVLACGNFGNKKNTDADIAENVFARATTPKMLFKMLQERGKVNWALCRKYRFLKPFAWIYQGCRYLRRGLSQKEGVLGLKSEYDEARKRNAMFEALGVKSAAKGQVVYRDGEYVKT